MLFLPENANYLVYVVLDACLEMQLDFVAERKRVSVNRRASRMSIKKSFQKNQKIFLEENNNTPIMSFGKKNKAVQEDIEEGTDTDPEKEPFGVSSSIYFNDDMQNEKYCEKGMHSNLKLF
jgi:hypothetical protein